MFVKQILTFSKSSQFFAIFTLMAGLSAGQAKAEDFNTGYVLNKMPENERTIHIDGTIRGIAFASYFHKNKDNDAFECVLNHALIGSKQEWSNMIDFLLKYPEKPLAGVLFVYLRKKCNL